jgi:hypothetical protein
MSGRDYMGETEAKFLAWSENFVAHSASLRLTFGFSEAELLALQDQFDAFSNAYTICQSDQRTQKQVRIKNDAKKTLRTAERAMVNRLQVHPSITDEYRDTFHIPIHDKKPTPVPPPSSVPEAEIKTPHPMVVEIHFRDEDRAKRGKPAGVQGAKIVYGLLDTPPATVEGLTKSAFDPRSPFKLSFQENERGHALYFALCWENAKGEGGPWSLIQKAIVP